MAHWTDENIDALIRRVTFDYWTQIQKRMESLPKSQSELAAVFGVSESAVSQTLNNSRNSQIKTMATYARELGAKFAIVLYEDADPENGPVNSEIFTLCWEKAGKPHTFGEVTKLPNMKNFALTSGAHLLPRKGAYLSRKNAASNYELSNNLVVVCRNHHIRLGGIEEKDSASTAENQAQTIAV